MLNRVQLSKVKYTSQAISKLYQNTSFYKILRNLLAAIIALIPPFSFRLALKAVKLVIVSGMWFLVGIV